jgi:hypothetical protein
MLQRLLTALALVIATLTPALAADPVLFPGTGWSLVPPPGFRLSDQPELSFRHDAGATIVLLQFPPGQVLDNAFAKGKIVGRPPERARVDTVRDLMVAGLPARRSDMTLLDQKGSLVAFVIASDTSKLMVMVSIPEAARPQAAAAIAALDTLSEHPQSASDRLSALPFDLPDLAGLEVSNVASGIVAVLSDRPGFDQDSVADVRVVIVAVLPQPGFVPERDANAMVASVRQRHPGIVMQQVSPAVGPNGPELTLSYDRPHSSGVTLHGLTLMRRLAGGALLVEARFPEVATDMPARVRAIFDAARPK